MNFIFHAKQHVEHLEYSLSKLRQNKFLASRAKSEFAQEEMDFLGNILSREGVRPNLKKLQVVKDYKILVMVKGIRSFLGLVNFYQKFIKGFSQMAKPLWISFKRTCLLNGNRSNKRQLKT